jgi:SAM-dependent methyltransferase
MPGTNEASLRDHWEALYGKSADNTVSWYQPRPEISLALISACGAGPESRIVDVGGGSSRLVDALLDGTLGRVTVLDISDAALRRAQQRLGARASEVAWVSGDVTRWRPASLFDVWHDRALFHFLARPEHRSAYVVTLLDALRVGGHAIIGTFAADGPERCSGLAVVRYEPETLAAELGPGLRLVDALHEEHVTPAGKVQRFQFSRFVRV